MVRHALATLSGPAGIASLIFGGIGVLALIGAAWVINQVLWWLL